MAVFPMKNINHPPPRPGNTRRYSPSRYQDRQYSRQDIPAELVNSPHVLIGTLQNTEFNFVTQNDLGCAATHRYTISDRRYYRNSLSDQPGAGTAPGSLTPGALTIVYLEKNRHGRQYISWMVQSARRQIPPVDYHGHALQNRLPVLIWLALTFLSGYPLYQYGFDINTFIFAPLATVFLFSACFAGIFCLLILADLWAAIKKSRRHEVRLYHLLISAGQRYADKSG